MVSFEFGKNKCFIKIYLVITVSFSSMGILLDLLGYLQIPAIQNIAMAIYILSFTFLLLLAQLIYLNINSDNSLGNRLKIMAHILNLLLASIPLLIGLIGLFSSMFLYFIMPTSVDLTSIGLLFNVILLVFALGYGIALSTYCFINLEKSKLWKF